MKKFVKPVEGKIIPCVELGGKLPPEGRAVEWNSYWRRRERDGDITVSAVPAAKETKSNPAKGAK